MNPEEEKNNSADNNHDAGNFHIAPEVGEQGEGPGEQPVRRVKVETIDAVKPSPRSINVTETTEVTEKISSTPVTNSRFNHGEEDVMQYFTETVSPAPASMGPSRPLGTPLHEKSSHHDEPNRHGAPSNPHPSKLAEAPTQSSRQQADAPTFQPSEHLHDHHNASGHLEPATKPKKTNLMATILIVAITVIITAIVVSVILLLTQQNKSKENQIVTANNTAKTVHASISCVKKATAEELKGAQEIQTTVIANYADKDLEDYSEMSEYTYPDADAAKNALSSLQADYNDQYLSLGYGQDPFSSTFTQNGNNLTVSHFAEAKNLTFENMDILGIPKTNGTNPDISAVKKALTDKGYSCKTKSDN